MRFPSLTALLLVASLLAACSSGPPAPGPTSAAQTAGATAQASRMSWVVPSVDATPGRIGKSAPVIDGAQFTVLEVRRLPDYARVNRYESGGVAAHVRYCMTETADVMDDTWFVYSDRGQEFPAPGGYGGDTKNDRYTGDMRPYYPTGFGIKKGTCHHGWIPFAVPDGDTAVLLRYVSPTGAAVD